MRTFTNQFQLSKTLRFELKPIGKTLENIHKKGFLTKDKARAKSYNKMKKTIDSFHKYFIDVAMSQVNLTLLSEYQDLYFKSREEKRTKSYQDEWRKINSLLRKEVVAGFSKGIAKDIFSKIDKKELITEKLEEWISTQHGSGEMYFDPGFKNFTTYFGGFHENRKNMYTDKEQGTAIAYRLIHENLPKFIENIKIYNEASQKGLDFGNIELGLKPILNDITLNEVFSLEYFNSTLTQSGIDNYNTILGGFTLEDQRTKTPGINEAINLFNRVQNDKKNKIPKLKLLYKQILSDHNSTSFLIEPFENSQDVLCAIEHFYKVELLSFQSEDGEETVNVLAEIKKLLTELTNYNLNGIFIRNDKAITEISNALFKDWSIIKSALAYQFEGQLVIGVRGLTAKQNEEKEKFLKQSYFTISEIEHALFEYRKEVDILNDLKESDHPVADYWKNNFLSIPNDKTGKVFDLISNIEAKYNTVKGILGIAYPADKELFKEKADISHIKDFLDSIMELLHFVKPLRISQESAVDTDKLFYSSFDIYFEQLDKIIPLYNKVRNYSSQKSYSIEKFKLNFENSTLLDGWDVNREEANTALLFMKNDLYYLGIMDMDHNKVFRGVSEDKTGQAYKKLVYKQLGDLIKQLPRVVFSSKWKERLNVPNEILEIKRTESYKTNLDDCNMLIEFYKKFILQHEDWNNYFTFKFAENKIYTSLYEFFASLEAQFYTIQFKNINEKFIDELVNDGKLYLFQIYNKDFSSYSKGRPNLHTIYWKALFDPTNLKNVIYKLNGQAEIFYRKKSILAKDLILHKAKNGIENKNPLALKKTSEFDYDIIKDKRYAEDKFQFHVPITLNFQSEGNDFINNDVLAFLQNNPEINIIGLDRGERHLIYLTMINQKGEILLQESLNSITSEQYNMITPYQALLDKKEKDRAQARTSWGVIENIKELKEGYLSQVIHRIAKLMVTHNAIVVMEDLNFGFKRGRFKVEKQVYQKLEKMLIDKLNYLVFKDQPDTEVGGLFKALQLTSKFKSFKEMGKQNGFLFYVPAWNTSKIDPTTGFVNMFFTQYESVPKSQAFFSKFQSIRFNPEQKYFEWAFDYNDFTTRAEGTQSQWTVCSFGDRILTFRNPDSNQSWDHKSILITEEMEVLFGNYNIFYGDGKDIRAQICNVSEKDFFSKLFGLFKLMLQMRNSISGTDVDFLISPVKNKEGKFFDSRKAEPDQPKDADANGALHIAKKGMWVLEQLNEYNNVDNFKKFKWIISNKDWLNFVQKNES